MKENYNDIKIGKILINKIQKTIAMGKGNNVSWNTALRLGVSTTHKNHSDCVDRQQLTQTGKGTCAYNPNNSENLGRTANRETEAEGLTKVKDQPGLHSEFSASL